MNDVNPLRIIEQFVKSRSDDEALCEDRIVTSEHFISVIDGATSKYSLATGEQPPGAIIADVLAAAVQEIPVAATCDEAIDFVSSVVRAQKQSTLKRKKEAAASAVVILSRLRREVWRVGDCLFRINDTVYGSENALEPHIAGVRSAFNQVEILSGHDISELRKRDLGREIVMPLLRKQQLLRNSELDSPFTFGVIDGNSVPTRFRERVSLPEELCQVVLCSDGYPKALGTLDESENYLRALLEEDPLCIKRHVATKGVRIGDCSFDDRAYVRAEL